MDQGSVGQRCRQGEDHKEKQPTRRKTRTTKIQEQQTNIFSIVVQAIVTVKLQLVFCVLHSQLRALTNSSEQENKLIGYNQKG